MNMPCQMPYVKTVRKAVNAATRQWELRGGGNAFNKRWEVHREAAEKIASTTFGSDPTELPVLIRKSYRTMAAAVRKRMATKRTGCAAARKHVAASTLEQGLGGWDRVKSCARRSAAYLLEEAGDAWVQDRSVLYSDVSIGGEALWGEVVKPALAAERNGLTTWKKRHDVPVLFGGFFAQFMADVRTRRIATKLPWGVAKTRMITRILRPQNIPSDPVMAAAYTAAALLLEAIPDGGSCEDPVTSSKSSAVRAKTRRALTPAAAAVGLAMGKTSSLPRASANPAVCSQPRRISAAAAVTAVATETAAVAVTSGKESHTPTASANLTPGDTWVILPPTRVSRTSWASWRYGRAGPADGTHGTKSTNKLRAGNSVNGLQSTAELSMPSVLESAAQVNAGGANVTAQTYSSGLAHRMVAAPEYRTSGIAGLMRPKTPFRSRAVPGAVAAAEALGTEPRAITTRPLSFGAVQGAGAVGFGSSSSGFGISPGNTSVAAAASAVATAASAAATAAESAGDWDSVLASISTCQQQLPLGFDNPEESSMPMLFPSAPVISTAAGAEAAANEEDDHLFYSKLLGDDDLGPLLLGDDALGPDSFEDCGMESNMPLASEPTWAAAAATAVTSSPAIAGAGLEGEGGTDATYGQSLSGLLPGFGSLKPGKTEVFGVEPFVPIASKATVAMTSGPVIPGAGVWGAGATVEASLPATLNPPEIFDVLTPTISSDCERMGDTPGFDFHTSSGSTGSTDGGDEGSNERRADNSGNEGKVVDHPCNEGPRKKARAG